MGEEPKMEYRGKTFTIVQGIGPDSWKWAVYSDEKIVKSGEAKTRASAQTRAIWVIDQVLASKKVKLPPAMTMFPSRSLSADDHRPAVLRAK
jgi:hypothetical protein